MLPCHLSEKVPWLPSEESARKVGSQVDISTFSSKWFDKAWNTVFDFGWGRPDVTPYFYYGEEKVPVTHNAKDVRLNVAKKGDAALLLFGNLGEATELAFDVAGLGFANPRITDAETGVAVDPKRLAIDRHGYRMIRADDRGDGGTKRGVR